MADETVGELVDIIMTRSSEPSSIEETPQIGKVLHEVLERHTSMCLRGRTPPGKSGERLLILIDPHGERSKKLLEDLLKDLPVGEPFVRAPDETAQEKIARLVKEAKAKIASGKGTLHLVEAFWLGVEMGKKKKKW